jgi:Cdc6-like AAA superfamily ATPase
MWAKIRAHSIRSPSPPIRNRRPMIDLRRVTKDPPARLRRLGITTRPCCSFNFLAIRDASKKVAWDAIVSGKSINVVVGPPGVGKTFLISHLVKSILERTPDARLLVSAQNHETLIQMEDELKKILAASTTIVVRVERTRSTDEISSLRASSVKLLRSVSAADHAAEGMMVNQRCQIKQALRPVDASETTVAERVFRDTDNLLLRSSDVTAGGLAHIRGQ